MGEMEREWRDGGEEKIKLGKMSRGGHVDSISQRRDKIFTGLIIRRGDGIASCSMSRQTQRN